MKKNRFLYSLSAVALACIISFSGLGNTYIQAEATSVGIEKGVWNDDVSVWENIRQYLLAFTSFKGLFINPVETLLSAQSFYDYMISDGVSHENAHGVFCDCNDATHTSFNGLEHGGGGFVRDGVGRDDDGQIVISDDVSDLFYGYISDALSSNYGWYIVPTLPISFYENNPTFFSTQERYNNFLTIMNTFVGENDVFLPDFDLFGSTVQGYVVNENSYDFVMRASKSTLVSNSHVNYNYFKNTDYYHIIKTDIYDSNWTRLSDYVYTFSADGTKTSKGYYIADSNNCQLYAYSVNKDTLTRLYYLSPVTIDGRSIRVFKNVDSMKSFNLNRQPYYCSESWNNYDNSIDNSFVMTDSAFQYYVDSSTNIYQNIQNNIINGGDSLSESDIQKIVEDTIKDVIDNLPSGDNSNNNDSDNNDSDDGGNGVGDLVGGIGDLLDTILSLIGKVMSVVADFTQSILDLFSGFTEFTDGFSSFLSGAFSFIPQEIWNVIQVGLSLMILLAVIKFLRK